MAPSRGSLIHIGVRAKEKPGGKYKQKKKDKEIREEKNMEMKKRSIAGCIILTFVTFGIYGIYWFVKLTNETNRLAPEEATMSGGLAFLVTLCTLGIYGLYWGYKLGKKMDIISGKESNSGIIYLLLTLLGLGIIAEALAQNELNGRIERQENGFVAAA